MAELEYLSTTQLHVESLPEGPEKRGWHAYGLLQEVYAATTTTERAAASYFGSPAEPLDRYQKIEAHDALAQTLSVYRPLSDGQAEQVLANLGNHVFLSDKPNEQTQAVQDFVHLATRNHDQLAAIKTLKGQKPFTPTNYPKPSTLHAEEVVSLLVTRQLVDMREALNATRLCHIDSQIDASIAPVATVAYAEACKVVAATSDLDLLEAVIKKDAPVLHKYIQTGSTTGE